MNAARLEHANITVANPNDTATRLCRLFGWKIRWEGPSAMGGRSVHVGSDLDYLALYTPDELNGTRSEPDTICGGLNHVGVLVDDLDAVEARVKAEGLESFGHADYEPGRRFYFLDGDGIEFEVVSYG